MKKFCVDIEIAKELEEKGYPQNSYFVFAPDRNGYCICKKIIGNPYSEDNINAHTSDELLEELPRFIDDFRLNVFACSESWGIEYYSERKKERLFLVDSKKLCNALARMWIVLKFKGYIK